MADRDSPPLQRRFVTRVDVENAHRADQPISLGPRDVITHEAAARAADLGVAVERPERSQPRSWTGVAPRPSVVEPIERRGPVVAGGRGRGDRDSLRKAVRAAIVAELGSEPPGLDDAIDRVMARGD